MRLSHITLGRLGLSCESAEELRACVEIAQHHGLDVVDIDSDEEEPYFAASIRYAAPTTPRDIRTWLTEGAARISH